MSTVFTIEQTPRAGIVQNSGSDRARQERPRNICEYRFRSGVNAENGFDVQNKCRCTYI